MERRRGSSTPSHCWVADAQGNRHPGLLLEWRKQDTGWVGLVTYVMADDAGGFSLVQEWVGSEALKPLTG